MEFQHLVETIFETSPIGMAMLDRGRRYVAINESLAEMNGIAREAHLGRSVADLFGTIDPELVALIDRVYERGEPFSNPRLSVNVPGRADRQPGYYDVLYTPVIGRNGELEGVLGYVIDITEAVKQERLNQEFLAILSHELRTPLNAILGWTTILLRAPSNDQIAHGLAIIERNARAQARLIDDLVDASRVLTGRLSLNKREIDVRSAIDAAVDTLRPASDAVPVSLVKTMPGEPVIAECDPARLQQIVLNIVSNAVKFTPAGGTVAVDLKREGGEVVLRVQDTGIGIAPDFLPFLFDRFRQGPSATGRAHGLGLAIVRDLVRLHGGSVAAESAGEGHGTTITVRLPAAV